MSFDKNTNGVVSYSDDDDEDRGVQEVIYDEEVVTDDDTSSDNNDDDDESYNSRRVYLRIKLGMIELNDVHQKYRPDVDIFFYYEASEEDKEFILKKKNQKKKKRHHHHYFQNLRKKDGQWPFWTPHFDFNSEVEEALITDESYWMTTIPSPSEENGRGESSFKVLIFGRRNMVPTLQNRINHTAFPYDRQILHVELLSNNCIFEHWNRNNDCPRECKLFYDQWHIQGELNSLADTWDLDRVRIKIDKQQQQDDDDTTLLLSTSSKANLFMYIQREPEYYTYNISLMLFIIVSLQNWIVNFPYNETRFEFALNLVLTQIAFRFVISNLVPRTSYLMYLDKYMQMGFILLILRFIIDWTLLLWYTVPNVEAGDDFRCGWKYDTLFNLDNFRTMPTICKSDFYATIFMFALWTIASIAFLFPNNWRRRWSTVEEAVEEDKLLESTFYEKRRLNNNNGNGAFSQRQLWANLPDQSIASWLKKHDKYNNNGGGSITNSIRSTLNRNNLRADDMIEKPFDIMECRKLFFRKKRQQNCFLYYCSCLFRILCGKRVKDDGMGRGCKELRGWTEPTEIPTSTTTTSTKPKKKQSPTKTKLNDGKSYTKSTGITSSKKTKRRPQQHYIASS